MTPRMWFELWYQLVRSDDEVLPPSPVHFAVIQQQLLSYLSNWPTGVTIYLDGGQLMMLCHNNIKVGSCRVVPHLYVTLCIEAH